MIFTHPPLKNSKTKIALFKGHMCGLCGDFNMQFKDDLQGPKTCMHSKPEVQLAAYR